MTVKRVDDGRVSNWFNDKVNVGDWILVQPPEGRFSLRSNEGEHGIVLFGGGSGVTPVLSILKSALRTTERDVKLIYANRDQRSIIFKDEIDLWLAEFPERLEVIHHLDSDGGFMSVATVQEHIRGWEEAEFFVCGPTGYMDTVEEAFKASNIDAAQTKFERFLSLPDPDRRDESAAVVPEQSDDEVPYVVQDAARRSVPRRALRERADSPRVGNQGRPQATLVLRRWVLWLLHGATQERQRQHGQS